MIWSRFEILQGFVEVLWQFLLWRALTGMGEGGLTMALTALSFVVGSGVLGMLLFASGRVQPANQTAQAGNT